AAAGLHPGNARERLSGSTAHPVYPAGSDSTPAVRHRAVQREYVMRRGQAALEFALLYSAVILPLTFMGVFVAEMLWTWHSVADLTRRGAQFAATSCWTADGSAGNVLAFMQTNVPPMIDMDQFQNGAAGIQVQYFTQNPDGTLTAFDGNNCGGGVCI